MEDSIFTVKFPIFSISDCLHAISWNHAGYSLVPRPLIANFKHQSLISEVLCSHTGSHGRGLQGVAWKAA